MNKPSFAYVTTCIVYAFFMGACLYLAISIFRLDALVTSYQAKTTAIFEETLELRQAIKFSTDYIQLLQNKNIDALRKYNSNTVGLDQVNMIIDSNILPTNPPTQINVIGAKVTDNYKSTVSLEYNFPNQSILIKVGYSGGKGHEKIYGIQFDELSLPLEQANKVELLHGTFKQYAALALYLFILGLEMCALSICFFSPYIQRKKNWMLFIVIGVFGFYFNWTTQAFYLSKPSSVTTSGFDLLEIFGASFDYSPYFPLVFTFSLPVGAVVFLLYYLRKRYGKPSTNEQGSGTPMGREEALQGQDEPSVKKTPPLM